VATVLVVSCAFIPGTRYIDWGLEDPQRQPLDELHATRDDNARRVGPLAADWTAYGGRRADAGGIRPTPDARHHASQAKSSSSAPGTT
jgi:hypothetical protein